MDLMTIRRGLLMQKATPAVVDLFDGSDSRNNLRVFQGGIGSAIQLVSSSASIVYAFACPLIAGEQYKIQYTVTNPIATNGRAWCISDADGKMVFFDGMVYTMPSGQSEISLTAHNDGFLWMTMDQHASDIHIYKV